MKDFYLITSEVYVGNDQFETCIHGITRNEQYAQNIARQEKGAMLRDRNPHSKCVKTPALDKKETDGEYYLVTIVSTSNKTGAKAAPVGITQNKDFTKELQSKPSIHYVTKKVLNLDKN